MYAIIESCGKQYKVAEGDVVFFEKLDAEEGKKVTFDKVILVSEEGKVQVGNPYVKGIKVEGKVVSHGKAKKIIVFKMKAKKNYRRKQGHRQPYTKVEITGIKTAAKKAETTESKAETKTAGGLIIPEAAQEKTQTAVVVEVGPGTEENPITVYMNGCQDSLWVISSKEQTRIATTPTKFNMSGGHYKRSRTWKKLERDVWCRV